jgi:hypothetical protein
MVLIPIPSNWINPRFEFGDRVRVEYPSSDLRLTGIVIGLRYFPDEAMTKPEEWEYDIVTEDGTILEPTPEDWIYLESQA